MSTKAMSTKQAKLSTNGKEEPKSDPKWTVMIYFAADNDLEEEAIADLKEMKKVGSTHEVNIVAQLDSRGRGKTFRFLIGDEQTTLDEDVVHELHEINTGDPRELTDFIVWGADTYEAENYMLVLWGHGRGWEDLDNTDRAAAPTTDAVIYRKDPAKACKDKREKHLEGYYSIAMTRQREIRTFLQGKTKRHEKVDLTDETEAQKPEVRLQSKFVRDEMGRQEIISRLRPQAASSSQDSDNYARQISAQTESKRADSTNSIGFLTDLTLAQTAGLSQDVLKMDELEFALAEARETSKTLKKNPERKIDILGMDACLMGMVEVSHQIEKHVKYLVASEDAIPDEGWPYERILRRLVKDEEGDMLPKDFALMITREFLLHYREQKKDVTKSVCDLEVNEALAEAIKALAHELMEKLSDNGVGAAVLASRAMAQSFYIKEFVDLYDFCSYLRGLCSDEKIKQCCKDIMNVICRPEPKDGNVHTTSQNGPATGNFVYDYGFIGHRLRGANGVSIYFPCFAPSKKYAELQFAKDTMWGYFLNKLAGLSSERDDFSLDESPVSLDDSVRAGVGSPQKVEPGTPQKMPKPLPRRKHKSPVTSSEEPVIGKTAVKRKKVVAKK